MQLLGSNSQAIPRNIETWRSNFFPLNIFWFIQSKVLLASIKEVSFCSGTFLYILFPKTCLNICHSLWFFPLGHLAEIFFFKNILRVLACTFMRILKFQNSFRIILFVNFGFAGLLRFWVILNVCVLFVCLGFGCSSSGWNGPIWNLFSKFSLKMEVRPSKSTFLAGEDISCAKIEALLRCLPVDIFGNLRKVEVVSDNTLHENCVELASPLRLVHVSLNNFLSLLVLTPRRYTQHF